MPMQGHSRATAAQDAATRRESGGIMGRSGPEWAYHGPVPLRGVSALPHALRGASPREGDEEGGRVRHGGSGPWQAHAGSGHTMDTCRSELAAGG